MELYGKAIAILPEFPEAEYQRASILETRNDRDNAESAYRRAISYRPDWTLPMAALGGLLVSKGEFTGAEQVLKKALDIDPMCIPCYPPLTELYVRLGTLESVLKLHLQKLSYLTSKAKIPANVWAAKAAVEMKLGDKAAARESLNRSFGIDPKDPSAVSENIELLLLEGDADAAVAAARSFSKENPERQSAKLQLARALYAAGEGTEAVRLLEPLESSEAKKVLNSIRSSVQQDPLELEKLLAEDPENAGLLGNLCSSYRVSDPQKALQYCLKASQLEPTNINHAIGYGAALLQLKRYPEAAALLKRLSDASPDNFTVRANFATALFQMGNYEEAKAQYQWITENQPDLAAAYFFLAICNDKLTYFVEAMANYQAFLKFARPAEFTIEIERVNLRLPSLQRQIKEGKGKN
jgi:tetratricopeptide (TPR) repeat protein